MATTEKPTPPKAKPTPAKPEKSKQTMTEYVVLRASGADQNSESTFIVEGTASGVTDTKAIETVRAGLPTDEQGSAFVAVPVRSWRIRKPKIETTVKTLWT